MHLCSSAEYSGRVCWSLFFSPTVCQMPRFVSLLVLIAYCLVSFVGHVGHCPVKIVENGLGCSSHVLCGGECIRGSCASSYSCDPDEKSLRNLGSKHQENHDHPRKCPSDCPDDCTGCHLVNVFNAQVTVCSPPSIESPHQWEQRCSVMTSVIPFDFTLLQKPRGPPSYGTCS